MHLAESQKLTHSNDMIDNSSLLDLGKISQLTMRFEEIFGGTSLLLYAPF